LNFKINSLEEEYEQINFIIDTVRNELKHSEQNNLEKDIIIEKLEKENKKRIMLTKNLIGDEKVEESDATLLKDEVIFKLSRFLKMFYHLLNQKTCSVFFILVKQQ
jgi:hypothetical protein